MTEESKDAIVPILRKIQRDLAVIKATMATRTDVRDLNARLSGLYEISTEVQASLAGHGAAVDDLEARIARLEEG